MSTTTGITRTSAGDATRATGDAGMISGATAAANAGSPTVTAGSPTVTAGSPTVPTGDIQAAAAARIAQLRQRIDEIDRSLITLWQERSQISQQVGAARVAAGGTRLVLSREREILDRFTDALGADGAQLALLLLRAGRGKL